MNLKVSLTGTFGLSLSISVRSLSIGKTNASLGSTFLEGGEVGFEAINVMRIKICRELCKKPPEDETEQACDALGLWLKENEFSGDIAIYGDASGHSRITDEEQKIFIEGNPFTKTGNEYFPEFQRSKHVFDYIRLDFTKRMHVMYDFNVMPYITQIVAQIDNVIKFYNKSTGEKVEFLEVKKHGGNSYKKSLVY